MKRLISAVVVTAVMAGLSSPTRADEKEAKALLDKAIKALGGEANLSKIQAMTWKAKGKISFGGNDSTITSEVTVQGLDRFRNDFAGDFMGNQVRGVTVLSGDKGWRRFGDMNIDLDKDGITNEKRNLYLQVIPITLAPLKEKGFKLDTASEEKVDGKPAAGLRVTGPDGKEFKLYFDKESGLPVKLVAAGLVGFMGNEFTQETTFGDYKDFGGIKKATKIEAKRDGERFLTQEITEFKVLDKVDPKTFAEPQ